MEDRVKRLCIENRIGKDKVDGRGGERKERTIALLKQKWKIDKIIFFFGIEYKKKRKKSRIRKYKKKNFSKIMELTENYEQMNKRINEWLNKN